MNSKFVNSSYQNPDRYCFYDHESTGTDTVNDQVVQSCIIETDGDLNLITDKSGNPKITKFYVALRPDVIPHPEAFMVHKIPPSILYGKSNQNLLTEFEAAKKTQDIFMQTANTCVAGFNTISFDDELNRQINFRNLLDPYAQEWKNGNHRTDIYKLVMLTRLYGESALKWPTKEDGSVSLKLEDLCNENGISNGVAHDAQTDVLNTIEVARLIKNRKPELFAKFKLLSDKRYTQQLLKSQNILVHTSMFVKRENYSTEMMLPVSVDPVNKNRFYGIDLSTDLTFLLTGDPQEIAHELFTKNNDKTHTPIPTGIKTIVSNKLPLLTCPQPKGAEPSEAGYARVADKANIDWDTVKRNEEIVKKHLVQIKRTIGMVFNKPPSSEVKDPSLSLYSGDFMTDAEHSIRSRQRLIADPITNRTFLESEDVVDKFKPFKMNMDTHAQLFLRAKWNTFYQNLLKKNPEVHVDPNEMLLYRDYLKNRLFNPESGLGITVEQYKERSNAVRVEWDLTEDDLSRLEDLDNHVDRVVQLYNFINERCQHLLQKAAVIRNANPSEYEKCFNVAFKQSTWANTSKDKEVEENNLSPL